MCTFTCRIIKVQEPCPIRDGEHLIVCKFMLFGYFKMNIIVSEKYKNALK